MHISCKQEIKSTQKYLDMLSIGSAALPLEQSCIQCYITAVRVIVIRFPHLEPGEVPVKCFACVFNRLRTRNVFVLVRVSDGSIGQILSTCFIEDLDLHMIVETFT